MKKVFCTFSAEFLFKSLNNHNYYQRKIIISATRPTSPTDVQVLVGLKNLSLKSRIQNSLTAMHLSASCHITILLHFAIQFIHKCIVQYPTSHRNDSPETVRNPDGVPVTSRYTNCRMAGIGMVVFLALNGLIFSSLSNNRLFVDQFVALPASKPKEIADAIQPPFTEFHDFRTGPRHSRYIAGNSMQALEKKYNQTKAVSPLYAGMCKLEGQFKRDNDGSIYAAAWLSSKETLFKNEKFTQQFMQDYQVDALNRELGFFAATMDSQILY
jgi:hypothetical protein